MKQLLDFWKSSKTFTTFRGITKFFDEEGNFLFGKMEELGPSNRNHIFG